MKKTWYCFKIGIVIFLLLTVAALVLSLAVNHDKTAPKQYTVTYDVGEYGKLLSPAKVNYGAKPELPVPECNIYSEGINYQTGEKVSLADYEFCGWYYNGEKMSGENLFAFNQDVTLVAKWRSLWTENY